MVTGLRAAERDEKPEKRAEERKLEAIGFKI